MDVLPDEAVATDGIQAGGMVGRSVMRCGRSPADLMAERDGLYYRLCARQFGGVDVARGLPVPPEPPRPRFPTAPPLLERTSA